MLTFNLCRAWPWPLDLAPSVGVVFGGFVRSWAGVVDTSQTEGVGAQTCRLLLQQLLIALLTLSIIVMINAVNIFFISLKRDNLRQRLTLGDIIGHNSAQPSPVWGWYQGWAEPCWPSSYLASERTLVTPGMSSTWDPEPSIDMEYWRQFITNA